MEQFIPVLVNAGVAGVVLGWFMVRLEKRLDQFSRAQVNVALQMVQLRLVIPQVPDWVRDEAEKDAANLKAHATSLGPPTAPNGGVSGA